MLNLSYYISWRFSASSEIIWFASPDHRIVMASDFNLRLDFFQDRSFKSNALAAIGSTFVLFSLKRRFQISAQASVDRGAGAGGAGAVWVAVCWAAVLEPVGVRSRWWRCWRSRWRGRGGAGGGGAGSQGVSLRVLRLLFKLRVFVQYATHSNSISSHDRYDEICLRRRI